MVMEESKSNSNAKIRLLGSLVASSKQKPLKKFAYTNEQGETFQMTKEEIKNQKGIEQAVKADVAKSKIKKIKQNMIDLIGLEVVQRMYRDKKKSSKTSRPVIYTLKNGKKRCKLILIGLGLDGPPSILK
ncbi:hypothetical protein Tco_1107989 [Tanacetum coccineum]